MLAREHGQLAPEVLGLPAQHVAEQHGGFVVEIVAGSDDVVAVFAGSHVEEMTFREAARRAWNPLGRPCGGGDVETVLVTQVAVVQGEPALFRERLGEARRLVGVLADAEADDEPVGFVAEVAKELPARE